MRPLDYQKFETSMEGVRDPGAAMYTDKSVKMVLTDPGTHLPFLLKAMRGKSVREMKLIKDGMLLQVECRPVVKLKDYKYDTTDMSEELIDILKDPVPDLVYRYLLKRLPRFDAQKLTSHINAFTDKSIKVMGLCDDMVSFIREKQQGMIDYLVEKLEAGKLKFYGDAPGENGITFAIGDFTDPQKPNLIYPVYGMRALLHVPTAPAHYVYVPWKAYPESSDKDLAMTMIPRSVSAHA